MATEQETAEPEATGVWATFRDTPLAAKAILAGVLLSRLGGFLNVFIVLYMAFKGYSTTQAASALSVYGIGSVVGTFLGAAIAHRMGARNATMVAMASTAVLTVSLLYLPNYPLLLGAILLVSIAAQIYRPAAVTLLSELTPPNRQVMIFGIQRFGLNLGVTIAPLLGFGLYYAHGHSFLLLFWGEGLVALIYAVIATFTIPAKTKTETAKTADATGKPAPEESYRAVFRDRRYLIFLVGMFINSAVYVQYLATLPLDIKAHHIQIFWYTLAVSLNGAMLILFELPATKFTQKWVLRYTVGITFTLVALGNAFYGLPLGAAVIIIGTVIWTLSEIVGGPSVFSYPAVAGPAHLRSRYIGSFQFVFSLGVAVGPAVGGVLYAAAGHKVWLIIAPFGLIAAYLGMIGVRSPEERAAFAKASQASAEPEVSGSQPA